MKISVIIATFRRGDNLLITLQDLKKVDYKDLEIIVVDQTSKDEYPTEIRQELDNLATSGIFQWIYYPRNYVYEARNYGAAISTGDWLLWLDDDVRVGPDLLNRFISILREDNGISIIQGGIISESTFNEVCKLYPDLGLQKQIDISCTTAYANMHESKQEKLLQLSPELQAFYCEGGFSQPVKNCYWVAANNMLIKRSAFEKLNGWDEFILNYGDRNLGIRAAHQGMIVQWYPEASIIHLVAKSGGSRLSDPRNPIRGWRACVSIWYLAFKYLKLYPVAFCKFGAFKAARYSFLLKYNFFSVNRFLYSLFSYFLAAIIGLYWSFLEPISSYHKWRQEYLQSTNILPNSDPLRRVP
ncbi:glycosyltransferase family 2 protein [Trichothermofontia sp.]